MLANRIAWVTGGARGLGEATARVLAREGARVVVTDLDQDACSQVVQVLILYHSVFTMKHKTFTVLVLVIRRSGQAHGGHHRRLQHGFSDRDTQKDPEKVLPAP
jgi:NAD(P)-dependent dehydrogenase (short-subunit alcohol dehydrogenase family)